MTKTKLSNQKGFVHLLILFLIVAVVASIGLTGWRIVRKGTTASGQPTTSGTSETSTQKVVRPLTAAVALKEAATSQPTKTVAPRQQTAPVTTQNTPVVAQPAPRPPVTTNCATPLYTVTNTEFMGNNNWLVTKKFKDALDFAGLTSIANGNKTVVFTINDTAFDSLTKAQLDFMYLSPANMRSVLGWQIMQSCVIFSPDLETTPPITWQTLNGPVTYTNGGRGHIGTAQMDMWDFFTSNGAVHYIDGYINPPQL